MTKSKIAILWGRNELLAQSMEFFLCAGKKWEVVKMSTETGIADLLDQTEKIQPDLIILYAGNCVNDPSLPVQLIMKQPNVKVVTMSLEDNRMQVYCKRSLMVQKVSDLLSIIEDSHFSDYSIQVEKEANRNEINL